MTEPSFIVVGDPWEVQVVRTPDTLMDPDDSEPHAVYVKPEPTKAELLTLIESMQRDWVQLNAFLNATARTHDWCSDYEDRLHKYNAHFEVLKLEGRQHGCCARCDSREQSRARHSDDRYLLPDSELERLRLPRDYNSDTE